MATVTRLFDSHTEALAAVTEIEGAGISHDKISMISNNADNWHEGHDHTATKGDRLGDANGDGDNSVASGAGKGGATGGVVGAGAGILAGLGMLAIPGLGPVVAAGWLASTAVGAAIGAAAGGVTGGLLGALKEAGHSDEDANVYAESVRRGATLISVKVHGDAEEARVTSLLDAQRGFDASARGQAYRQTGWSGFDVDAAPLTGEDISRERALYR